MTEAEKERAEQIANAEAAFRRGEITAEFLAWYRRFTAKAILERGDPAGSRMKWHYKSY